MPTTASFSARNSRVSVNGTSSTAYGTFLLANHWSLAAKVDELDVTTFEEFGFCRYEDGLMDGDVTFDGFWDSYVHSSGLGANSKVASAQSPPLIYPGATLAYNHFFIKGSGTAGRNGTPNPLANNPGFGVGVFPFYHFPELKVFTCNVDAGVRGTLNVSFTAKANGAFYFPQQDTTITNPRNVWY